MIIPEGGNVFRDSQGRPRTQSIDRRDIEKTVRWLEKITGIDFTSELDDLYRLPQQWLGSTGRKEQSNDLDLQVDANTVSKEQLIDRLSRWVTKQGEVPAQYIKKSGISVHFLTPIAGDASQGYVQTDFMFTNKPEWHRFILQTDPSSKYRGVDKTVLIQSVAKSLGYNLNQNQGIVDRNTKELVTDEPTRAAKLLLGQSADSDDLRSVEKILAALNNDPQRDAKLADFKEYMQQQGTPLQETQPSEVSFLARLRDRIVNQGMYQLIEDRTVVVEQAVEGGQAKGIEHLEDLVFRRGSRGVREALSIVGHLAQNPQAATVKWDGKPAVVFGRDENGKFVLTDTSGFIAKGYNGRFTDLEQLKAHMALRDQKSQLQGKPADRVRELVPIYATLWPRLEAATPKRFRGFLQGDLMFTQQPPLIRGVYVFQPNTIEYQIPAASELGKRISRSQIGIALHTYYTPAIDNKSPVTAEQTRALTPPAGLMLIEPVTAQSKIKPDAELVKQIRQSLAAQGRLIDNLFNPTELRQQRITDLPRLCLSYINSIIADESVTGFDNLLHGFVDFAKQKCTASKYNSIVEYLSSPQENAQALAAAFDIFRALHDLKTDIQQKLDMQNPGQEGWVISTPAGLAKAVNRFGFTRQNRARNN